MRAKRRFIDGVEYMVLGTTIERDKGFRVIYQSWTTTAGKVEYRDGKYTHPKKRLQHRQPTLVSGALCEPTK